VKQLFYRKSLESLRVDADAELSKAPLRRELNTFALTCFGVGSTIGAGVFVLTGTVAAQHTGPAVSIAYLLASGVCLLAGLCYAELASMTPVAGSAYSYTYASIGEGAAWVVGWSLLLEYLLSVSIVAIGWSGYARSAFAVLGVHLPRALTASPFELRSAHVLSLSGAIIDLPAVLVTLACVGVVLRGTGTSAKINNVVVLLKVAAILVVLIVGFGAVHPANWLPIVPHNTGAFGDFGWSGILRGASILFFAYTGFDAVSTLGQESHDPQRAIPLSLLSSLAICALIYILVGLLVTGLVDYHLLNVPDPIYLAISHSGRSLFLAQILVAVIAVFGLISVMIVNIIGQVRIFYAMGRDGLLPPAFCRVHAATGTPRVGTIVTGVVAAILAGILPLDLLGELASIGTLLAFAVVCIAVLVLRKRRPQDPRPFRVPWAPYTPLLGAISCFGLMLSLPAATWVRLGVWLILGAFVYCTYGARNSALRRQRSCPHVSS
jgi:basic amino acid/polyamine antiporter, APA family